MSKMLYLHLETVEDIFEAIEEIVIKVRESDKVVVCCLPKTISKVENFFN